MYNAVVPTAVTAPATHQENRNRREHDLESHRLFPLRTPTKNNHVHVRTAGNTITGIVHKPIDVPATRICQCRPLSVTPCRRRRCNINTLNSEHMVQRQTIEYPRAFEEYSIRTEEPATILAAKIPARRPPINRPERKVGGMTKNPARNAGSRIAHKSSPKSWLQIRTHKV